MPKSNRGGKTVWTGPRFVAQPSPPAPTQDDDDNTTQVQPINTVPTSVQLDKFRNLTDDEKADIIDSLTNTPIPVFLAQNSFQKLTYGMKLNDKPTLVDDKTLDSMGGQELFRAVNRNADSTNRLRYDADEVATQILRGSVTRVSDTGGSVYGRGIYFAGDYGSSAAYGHSKGDIKKTSMIRGKLNPGAKTISYSQASQLVRREIASGSKLGKALRKADGASQSSIYALSKGYDVMTSGHGYYVVLNRGALTMSDKVKSLSNKW